MSNKSLEALLPTEEEAIESGDMDEELEEDEINNEGENNEYHEEII